MLLEVEGLKKYFPVKEGVFQRTRAHIKAVDNVSLSIREGETLGLVGESGCGKTTLGRAILRLTEPTAGSICFQGIELTGLAAKQMRKIRPRMQIIFQDPYSSLNPRKTVLDLVGEGLSEHRMVRGYAEKKERVIQLLETVGLPQQALHRYPHEFSGGQRQRIGIARAISLRPSLIICDEPVSSLDVSIQAQIINLLMRLRDEMKMSYLFVAHDLAVVKHIADRIAVMYMGQIVEVAGSEEIFQNPGHPYTQALISAVPVPVPGARKKRAALSGEVATLIDPPDGCRFAPRCPSVMKICREMEPEAYSYAKGRLCKCFLFKK